MFVLLTGAVTISQRDGLGRVTPIVTERRGQFVGEVAQLSGRPRARRCARRRRRRGAAARPEQLRALIIAEADLGERIVRALILRRVGLIESGASGPVLVGRTESPEVLRLQNFLSRNGQPHRRSTRPTIRRPRRCSNSTALPRRRIGALSEWRGTGEPFRGRACPLPRHPRHGGARGALRRHRRRRRPRGPCDRRLCGLRRLARHRPRLPLVRRTGRRQRPHRELPRLSDRHLRPGARRARVRAGTESSVRRS